MTYKREKERENGGGTMAERERNTLRTGREKSLAQGTRKLINTVTIKKMGIPQRDKNRITT